MPIDTVSLCVSFLQITITHICCGLRDAFVLYVVSCSSHWACSYMHRYGYGLYLMRAYRRRMPRIVLLYIVGLILAVSHVHYTGIYATTHFGETVCYSRLSSWWVGSDYTLGIASYIHVNFATNSLLLAPILRRERLLLRDGDQSHVGLATPAAERLSIDPRTSLCIASGLSSLITHSFVCSVAGWSLDQPFVMAPFLRRKWDHSG